MASIVPPGGVTWSAEARVIRHPFRVFRELGSSSDAVEYLDSSRQRWWILLRRPLFYLLFMGAFVSMFTAGRLVAVHLVFVPLAWSFVPLVMMAIMALILRWMAPDRPRAQALDQFFITVTPWYLWLALVLLVCFVAPDVYAAFTWLLFASFLLPLSLLGVLVWSMVLTFAFFRGAVGFERKRALLASVLYYGALVGVVCAYYLVTYQIQQFIFRE